MGEIKRKAEAKLDKETLSLSQEMEKAIRKLFAEGGLFVKPRWKDRRDIMKAR